MATIKTSSGTDNAAMAAAQEHSGAALRKDGLNIDVQNLSRKLLKNQRSRLAPSMGIIAKAG